MLIINATLQSNYGRQIWTRGFTTFLNLSETKGYEIPRQVLITCLSVVDGLTFRAEVHDV